jgi:hypothetical protein
MPDGDKSQPRPAAAAAAPAVPAEALLVCPECRRSFRPAAFETHLRQAHRIFQFRGVRRSFNDTFATLLDALVGERVDSEAWRTLAAIAVEQNGARADFFLATTLGQVLTRVPPERRSRVIDELGALLGASGATGLALTLASDDESLARQLALEVIAHLPRPLDPVLIPPLRGLLLDRRLPVEAQFDALAAALQSIGAESLLAEELLQTLVSGLGKAKSIERLRRFESRAGTSAMLDAMCARLEDRLRMNCPRCETQLRRPEMIQHLWDVHRLVLDRRRVREPWSLVEEWIDIYQETKELDLLDRCRTLVQRLDPDEEPRRLHRLMLSRGIADEEARRSLTRDASEKHAACCPWCYGLVPMPREVPPLALNQYRGRLSAGGYRVEVSEDGMLTSLEIVTPTTRIFRGREPGQSLTAQGAMMLLVAPLVLLALVWAFGLIGLAIEPLLAVLVILVLALGVHLTVRRSWRQRVPAALRARNYAWTMLAPRLHADGFRVEDSAFLAGLALISEGDHFEPLRAPLLPDLVKRTENALVLGSTPPGHLAALRRLMVEDAVWRGADPVTLTVELLARCFEGRWSLLFAEHLLAGWETSWWTPGNCARLRVLLCDRAFEAGFEIRNLLDAGQTAPALGALLGTDERPRLAALRLLWSLRATRPWDRCGDPLTVFDLAADPKREELLGRYPDLLLYQEEPDWLTAAPGVTEPKPSQILFCVRGVLLQGVLFTETPRVVEVNARFRSYDLIIGEHRFRSSGQLDALALRMERWFRYAFSEFLPSLPRVEKWKAPDRIAILRAWGSVNCRECGRALLPRVGEVGIALEEEEKLALG